MSFFLTTSHKPSKRTRTFVNELSSIIPRARRDNRGKKSLEQLFMLARELGTGRVLIIAESHGNPGKISGYLRDSNGSFDWSFDWIIRKVELRFETKISKTPLKFTKLCFKFSDTHPDIQNSIMTFFAPVVQPVQPSEETLELTILHGQDGFVVDPVGTNPKIYLSEILLPRKEN